MRTSETKCDICFVTRPKNEDGCGWYVGYRLIASDSGAGIILQRANDVAYFQGNKPKLKDLCNRDCAIKWFEEELNNL